MKAIIKNWRRSFPVLVPEAQERIAVGVIRSLGRAGYPVIACSEHADAVGFHSNFVTRHSLCPPYQTGEFIPWLRRFCEEMQIACIIPTEYLLLEISTNFAEFAHLLPLSSDANIVYRGISKFDLFDTLRGTPATLPPLLLIGDRRNLPSHDSLDQLGKPLFIKADGRYRLDGLDSEIRKVPTVAAAQSAARQIAARFSRFVVQGYVPGQGVGAFVLRWQGQVLAQFMHLRLHEVPHHGWSSYRKSWWHEHIMQDACERLAQMQWQGVAMMEYRWDPASDEFRLIEMNGRFWGSLHLALYADVDFPAMLLDAFHGELPQPVTGKTADVRCRNTVLELRYVWSKLRDSNESVGARLWVIAEFFLLMLNPKVKSDLLFPGDRQLFWWQLQHLVRRSLSRRKAG